MYANGHGVNQDYTTACMWFNISTYSVDPEAKELGSGLVQSLSPLMLPEQMTVAEQMAKIGCRTSRIRKTLNNHDITNIKNQLV